MDLELKAKQSPSTWRVAKTVMWSFLGIRNSQRHTEDIVNLSFVQIAIAGVIGGILFVLTLLSVVNFLVP